MSTPLRSDTSAVARVSSALISSSVVASSRLGITLFLSPALEGPGGISAFSGPSKHYWNVWTAAPATPGLSCPDPFGLLLPFRIWTRLGSSYPYTLYGGNGNIRRERQRPGPGSPVPGAAHAHAHAHAQLRMHTAIETPLPPGVLIRLRPLGTAASQRVVAPGNRCACACACACASPGTPGPGTRDPAVILSRCNRSTRKQKGSACSRAFLPSRTPAEKTSRP